MARKKLGKLGTRKPQVLDNKKTLGELANGGTGVMSHPIQGINKPQSRNVSYFNPKKKGK